MREPGRVVQEAGHAGEKLHRTLDCLLRDEPIRQTAIPPPNTAGLDKGDAVLTAASRDSPTTQLQRYIELIGLVKRVRFIFPKDRKPAGGNITRPDRPGLRIRHLRPRRPPRRQARRLLRPV